MVGLGGLDVDRIVCGGGALCNCAGEGHDKSGDNDGEDANAVNREEVCTKHSHEGEKTQHQRVVVDRRQRTRKR